MTKIVLLGLAGGMNKGTLALLYSIIETINRFVPDVEFVLSTPTDVDMSRYTPGLKEDKRIGRISIREPRLTIISLVYLFKCILINIFNRFCGHVSISENSRLFEYYDSDVVINGGGDNMSGETGFPIDPFINILYAILLNKPIVLYAESLGYFSNPIHNSIAKFIFNRTKLILVREDVSKKWLDDKDIHNPQIYVTADPAFLLDPVPQSRVFEILSNEGIDAIQKPVIGVNPSGLISRFREEGQKAEKDIASIMARVIDNLIENLNVTIIMIPHVYTPEVDDRIAINSVFHKVKNKSKVKTIKNEYSPQELKGIIGQCDLFIGARMHATIAATSMLVPTVGIAYSHKMHGIIGEMLGQRKYILDIKELDYENLISTIKDAWENREEIKKELEVKIPMVKEKAMLNGKLVKELLDSLNNPK
ncbi:MAG: polysaccharide pyruvyl transferase family protein [Methanophagales archaeon]|nr:polysaccharide pyruvyl transferase family protein [Methanophagales archaeon]